MASAKKTQIVITANAAVAKKVMDELQQRIDGIKQKMASLDVTTKQGQKEFKKLEKELVSYNSAVSQNITNTERIDKAMKNLSGTSLNELKRALSAAKSELGKMSSSSSGLKQMQGNVKALQDQIDKLTGSVHKQSNSWSTAMKNFTAYVGLFAVFNQVKTMITGVIKKNYEMSDSLADIRKVSGLLSQDIDKMAVSLAKIDTRTTIQELNQIAYAGAKLGIGNYGPEGLESFVKAANQVNVALKEDLGEEALTALSKITEVMGLIPKMGVEQSMLKVGSSIFKLASTTTATSNKIIDFSNRLLAMGKVGALSTSDILALGAAVDSMAMEPEVASTAFSKMITEMRKGTNLLEKDLGLAQGSLKELLEQGKGMEALQTIFHKMNETGNVFALDRLFKDLGSDGARLVKVMVTMAEKVDMLDKVVATSKEAFNEGIAVTQEYNIQQATAQGILERANNMWNKAFVNPDGINAVKQLSIEWYDFSKALTESSYAQKSVLASITILTTSVKVLINILPALIGFFAGKGFVNAAVGIWNICKAVWAWVAAQKALNLAMSANAVGAIISALALAYTWFQKDADAAEQAAKSADKFTKSLRDAKNEVGKAVVELDEYKKAIDNAKKGTKERQAAIDNFNSKFGSYLSKLITEKSTAEDLAQAYNEAANAIERKVMAQNKEKDIEQHVAPKAGREAQLLYDYDQKAKENKQGQYNGNWLKSFVDDNLRKHGTEYTINELIRRSNVGASYNKQARAGLISSLRNTNGVPAEKYQWTHISPNYNGGKRVEYLTKEYTEKERQVAMAVAYIRQRAAREKSQDDVSEKYKYYPDNLLTENVEGVTTSEKPDKDAIKKEKQDKRERERSWREELKQKQDEANAIMDNVRNFYERQINEKLAQAIALGMDKTEQDLFVEPVKRRMNMALEQVRLALAGQANTWDEIKETMSEDLIEKADETGVNLSEVLLQAILDNDIDALRKKLSGLAESLGRPVNSVLAEILAKATKNAQDNLNLEAKQAEVRRKIAQENDYFAVVKQNMYDDFNSMGYANPTDSEIADKEAFDKRKENIIKMYEQGRKELSRLYSIDVSTEQGRGLLMQTLFGDDEAKMGERIKAVLKDNEADWRTFYNKLIQYSDEYVEAEKRTYDRAKKIADQMWKINQRNIANQERLRKIQNEASLYGKRTNFGSNLGLADLTADPEVELMKLKMQMAEDYYAFVFKNSKNQQLIDEADRARQEAELAYAKQMATAMKERLSQMQQLVNPIVDFGEATGKALAQMKDDAEGANEAIKSALKSMLESWGKLLINDVNTQMWKGINDAGAKRALKKAQPDIDNARAKADANAVKEDLTNLGTAGNPMYVYVVNGRPVDENGNPVPAPLTPAGDIVTNPDGTKGLPPAPSAGKGGAQWDPFANQDRSSVVFKDTASATGDAIADAATGGSSFGEAAAGIAGTGISEAMNAPIKKNRKDDVKEERKHQKELTQETKKGQKDREKETNRGMGAISDITKEGNTEQSKNTIEAQTLITNATESALNANLQKKQEVNDETLKSDAARTEGEVTFSIAGAMAKCFEFLGPIAGPIAAAVVMSTLMGLLQWALNSALGGSKSKSNTKATKNTKLVSGMLTYDSGNVQDLKPFVSDKGDVYWATEDDGNHSGVSLLTKPTATTINGQPSLVAERGPELVIGRETTQAMMMNNPALLKALVNYDRNYSGRRAYNAGNVSQSVGNIADGASAAADTTEDGTPINAALLQAVNALLRTNNALVQRLNEPINAKIDMYGRGNLYDSMSKATQFMKSK